MKKSAPIVSGVAGACLFALTVSVSGQAWGQQTYADTARMVVAEACARAKANKPHATTSQEKFDNIVALQDCGEDGIELLTDYWRNPAEAESVVDVLAGVSGRVNDRRLYQAARSALLDRGRSETSRLGGLSVMVAGYDPSLAVAFSAPTKPMITTYVSLGHVSHADHEEKHQPVRAYARKDLPAVLRGLAASEPNERIRKVAEELGPLLARRDSTQRANRAK